MDTLLTTIYIATTVFGIGVTIIDMFGILFGSFHHGHDGDSGSHHGHDDGGHSSHQDHSSDKNSFETQKPSYIVHDQKTPQNSLLKIVALLRNVIYFCLGFGPVGLFAVITKTNWILSLLWSIPVGLIVMFLAGIIRKFQVQNLDSQLDPSDFFMAEAEVIVSINKGQMGKIRITLNNVFTDQYAYAEESDKSFPVGTRVMVTKITDDKIFVSDLSEK